MEQSIATKGLSLWWSKVGKWQVLATIITLTTFFITLSITGDKEAAYVVAFAAVAVVTFITVAAVVNAAVVAFAVAIALVFVVTVAAFVVVAAFAFTTNTSTFIIAALIIAAFIIAVAAFADEATKYGVSKKVIWLSYVAQWILIIVPMLITILH